MTEVLKKGSVEPLLIGMRDRLDNINTLDDVVGRLFDVRRKSDNVDVQTNGVWTVDPDHPMTVICVIDTTLVNYTPGDRYKVYLKFTESGIDVIKHVGEFGVEDD